MDWVHQAQISLSLVIIKFRVQQNTKYLSTLRATISFRGTPLHGIRFNTFFFPQISTQQKAQ